MAILSFRGYRRGPASWWFLTLCVSMTVGFTVVTGISRSQAAADRLGGLTAVFVTTRDLPPGTLLRESDVRKEEWPRKLLPQSPVLGDVAGAITATAIAAGLPVVEAMVAPAGLSTTAAQLHAGERGVAIPTAARPLLRPGDWVDLFAGSDDELGRQRSSGLASGARVIEVGDGQVTVAVEATKVAGVAAASATGKLTVALMVPEPPS